MDTGLAFFDYVSANLATIVTLGFALSGMLAQAAAFFNLSGLSQISTALHDAVQFTAGNWGRAANLVKVLETYRAGGPAAALGELAVLAKDIPEQDDSALPPGAAPAAVLLAVMIGFGCLTACAPLTAQIDKVTGSTLTERCRIYQAGDLTANALALSFPELGALAAIDDAAVKALCASPATVKPATVSP